MCKRPISLRNPSTAWNYLNDSLYIHVPCGTCSDCENKSRFDWQIRVYYEYLRCHDIGGFTIYATFTYDDEHLPLAYVDKSGRAAVKPRHRQKYIREFSTLLQSLLESDPDAVWDPNTLTTRSLITNEIEKDTVMSCFSKEDVQRFTKNVDTACGRRGEKFGYIITSEYGHYEPYTDHHGRPCIGTSRPHYHGLFFFDGAITPEEACKLLISHWKEFGTVKIGGEKQPPHEYGQVNGAGAIGYVCKYLQKSRDNAEALRKHLLLHKDTWLDIDQKRLNRNFSSFHVQSHGLGLYCQVVTPESLLSQGKTKFPMYDKDQSNVAKMMVVDLPVYIERKLFCYPQKDVPNRSYVYNEKGVQLKAQRLLEHRNNLIHEIEDFLALPNDYITNPDVLKHINHQLGLITNSKHRRSRPMDELGILPARNPFLRAIDFANAIKQSLGSYSVQALVDYALLFQGLIDGFKLNNKNDDYEISSSSNIWSKYLQHLSQEDFLNYAEWRYRKDRSKPFSLDSAKTSYYSRKTFYIRELEAALKLYSAYTAVLGSGAECAIQDKIIKQKRKEFYYLHPQLLHLCS